MTIKKPVIVPNNKNLAVLVGISLAVVLVTSVITSSQGAVFVKDPPLPLLGGQNVVFSQGKDLTGNDVRWILPGPRELDQDIFGVPNTGPLGFEDEFGWPCDPFASCADTRVDIGVPGRNVTGASGMPAPTLFSNNHAVLTDCLDACEYIVKAKDKTIFDDPASLDEVNFNATFISPIDKNGDQFIYEVNATKALPVGPAHPFMGGVGTNFAHHGITAIGSRLMPTTPTYFALWAAGSLVVKNATSGEVLVETPPNRLIHVMTTCKVRTADTGDPAIDEHKSPLIGVLGVGDTEVSDYDLVADDDLVDCSKIHTHVVLFPVKVGMPPVFGDPVPTKFILPNDKEQPFLHIMFENIWLQNISGAPE